MSGESIFSLLGKVDNLNDPVPTLNQRPAVLGVTITFLILSWICAGARLYTRFFIARCPGWDDLFVVLAVLTNVVLSVATALSLDHGLGKHFIKMSLPEMTEFIKSYYPTNASYAMAATFIKMALLLQYLRLFKRGSKLRFVTILMAYITAVWGLSYSFIAWVPSIPVAAYWDISIVTDNRWGFGSHDPKIFAQTYESHVATNVVLDLIVFAIPIPLYFSAGLELRARIGLLGLFILGALVNMFGIWRLTVIMQSAAGTYPTLDPSFYGCVPIVLAALEIDLATICASLPVFWPVLESNLGWIFVTREVAITHEPRFGSADEAAELCHSHPPLPPPQPKASVPGRKRYSDPFVRWHVDPLHRTKPSRTTVEASGRKEEQTGSDKEGFIKMQEMRKNSQGSFSFLDT